MSWWTGGLVGRWADELVGWWAGGPVRCDVLYLAVGPDRTQARLLCLLGPSSLADSPKGNTVLRSPLELGRLIA